MSDVSELSLSHMVELARAVGKFNCQFEIHCPKQCPFYIKNCGCMSAGIRERVEELYGKEEERMNKVVLMGRLTKDPEVRYSKNGDKNIAIARYTLAIDRRVKNSEGQQSADFINCVAFGGAGEFAEKYLHKGMKMVVIGRLQTGSYTNKDGQKIYTTDVVVEDQEFAESKGSNSDREARDKATMEAAGYTQDENGFMSIPDGIDEELPFN